MALEVHPFKPTSKAPGSKRLKLKHDELLSNFAFSFNLRRYILADGTVYTNVFVPGQANPLVQTSSVSTDGGKVFKAGAYTRYHESST
jgi:hypothetical protein